VSSETDICVQLGRRIRTLRQKQGWTQFEMSERLGIDRSYLAEVETGKIEVCLRNLALIAQAFGLKAWQLLKF
jgi:transcriptional regulator with XRE-family HTH domain